MKLRNKYFRVLIITYLCILLVPLSVGSLSYVLSRRAIEDEIYRANLARISQALTDLDRHMQQKDLLLSNISLDTQVNEFLSRREPLVKSDRYLLYNISSFFSVLQNTYSFIGEFYVYFSNSDTLVAPGAVYTPDIYYQNSVALRGMEFDVWKRNYLTSVSSATSNTCVISDENSDYLSYVQSLPISLKNASSANIVVHVEKKKINAILAALDAGAGSSYYLISDNQLLLSGGDEPLSILDYTQQMAQEDGFLVLPGEQEQIALTYVSSGQLKWKLVYAMPIGTYMQKVENIKHATINIFIIALVIGLVLVVAFTYHAYTPLRKIVAILHSPAAAIETTDEFDYIQTTLLNVLEKDRRTGDLLEKQRPLVRRHLLSRLVNGSLDFGAGTLDLMGEVGIKLPYDHFAACALRVPPHLEAMDQAVLIPIVEKRLPALEHALNAHVYASSDNRGVVALVINLSRADAPLEAALRDLSAALSDELQLPVCVGIGRPCAHMTSIVRSFAQATRALDYAALGAGSCVCSYDNIVQSDQHYYYPFEVEQQLATFLRAAQEDKAQHLAGYLFLENLEKRALAPEMVNIFFLNLVGTIIRVASEMHVADEYPLPQKRQPLPELVKTVPSAQVMRDSVCQMIARLCAAVDREKNIQKKPLTEAIVSFIHEHCCDASFDLQTLCDNFNLSPAYLSRFFKEQMGENFSSFLSRQRVVCVKSLLGDWSLSMAEVAQMSGFTNQTTFVRVFKKHTGVSPSTFRQQLMTQSGVQTDHNK